MDFLRYLRFWSRKDKEGSLAVLEPPKEINYMTEVVNIRRQLQAMGWKLVELPIRKGENIVGWKITAIRGDRSFTTQHNTQLACITRIATMLGVLR